MQAMASRVFRILRSWKTCMSRTKELYNFHMILLDQHGDQTHAIVPSKVYANHSNQLKEQNLIVVSDYLPSDFKGKWKPISGNQALLFTHSTRVYKHNDDHPKIPAHKFVLTDLNDLAGSYGYVDNYIDVVGVVIGMSDLEKTYPTSKDATVKRELLISSERGVFIRLTLWEDAARQVDRTLCESADDKRVLVATSTMVEKYNGLFCLSSTHATRLYIDLNIPEVINLKARYQSRLPFIVLNCENKFQMPIEKRLFFNRMTLQEGFSLVHNEENLGMTFTCKATVVGIVPTSRWYYLTCPKCNPEDDSLKDWYFSMCRCEAKISLPRFKLELRICDISGNAKMAIVGMLATKILFDDSKRVARLSEIMHRHWATDQENKAEKVAELRYLDNLEFVFEMEVIKEGNYRTLFIKHIYPLNNELEDKYELEQLIDAQNKKFEKMVLEEHNNRGTHAKQHIPKKQTRKTKSTVQLNRRLRERKHDIYAKEIGKKHYKGRDKTVS